MVVDPAAGNAAKYNDIPPLEQPNVPDTLDPPGWTWDSETVKMDSEIETMDAGYTTEQIIYLLSL